MTIAPSPLIASGDFEALSLREQACVIAALATRKVEREHGPRPVANLSMLAMGDGHPSKRAIDNAVEALRQSSLARIWHRHFDRACDEIARDISL